MKTNTLHIESCFHLLQKVVLNAFQTEVLYYTPPYNNLSYIDQGIREVMWPGYSNKDDRLIPSLDTPERRFFVIRSNLGFYNLIVYLNYEEKPDFISVGPFRSEDFSEDFFHKLKKDLNLQADALAVMQKYYEELPYVSLSAIISVTKEIISAYFPEFHEVSPIFVEFSNQNRTLQFDSQIVEELSADYSENYQKALLNFIDVLIKGSMEQSMKALNDFLHVSRFFHTQNPEKCKRNLYLLNDYCQLALLNTNVHPSYVLKLYSSMRNRIDNADSRDAMLALPNDICHKYSIMIKNYAFTEYSKTIRSVINYIHLHLEENLTLSMLADYFKKNASSLSSSFSKEVGMSITNYIHQARINESLRYFNSTKMSISEVALTVGFQDFAYFSRLFHKQVGCSPRDYCKSIGRK